MKKVSKPIMILILTLTLTLSACQREDVQTEEPVESGSSVLVATVLEVIGQDQLLVEPVEGSRELSSADRIVAHTNEALVMGAEGDETTIESFEVGSRVEITYDGRVAESYPAQIWPQQVKQIK